MINVKALVLSLTPKARHTVVEVGGDFVILWDIAGVKEVVVPVFAVKLE